MSTNKTIVKDAAGRELHVVEMDPADQLDLFEACAEFSTNSAWTGMALLVCSVVELDGKPLPMPKKPEQVKARARMLGKDGITAVALALNPKKDEDAEEDVMTSDPTVNLAKN